MTPLRSRIKFLSAQPHSNPVNIKRLSSIRHMRRIKSFVSVITVLSFTLTGVATAEDQPAEPLPQVSLTASPAIIDAGMTAGGETNVSFKVTNNSAAILPIHMNVRDSRTREGQPGDLMSRLSARAWVTFANPDFILQPKESKDIDAVVRAPKDAPSGGHYADLIVQPLSLESDSGIVIAKPELVVQLLVNVAGNMKESLDVILDGPSLVVTSPSSLKTISFKIKNNGNIHTLFSPKLYLFNNRKGATIDSQPEIVLPGEIKKISFTLPKDLQLGVFRSKLSFDYGAPSKSTESQVLHIVVLPFQVSLLLIIPLLAVTFYAYHIRRQLKRAFTVIIRGEKKI